MSRAPISNGEAEAGVAEVEIETEVTEAEVEAAVETADPGSPSGAEVELGSDQAPPPIGCLLEAVLFAAAEPIPAGRLARLLAPWPRAAVLEAIAELAAQLESGGRGVRLIETKAGYQLRSAAEAAPWIRRFFTEKPPRLSRPMLETVAIIAYRQPVTRGEIEAIRGVNCDAVLGALVTRSMVRVVGRRQSPGRPVEYGTTDEFLDLFSLRDLTELPPLPDPAALLRLIETNEEEQEAAGGDAAGIETERGAAAEDLEPGGLGVAPDGGGPDPSGTGEGERPGDPRAGHASGSDPGSDHD